MVRRAFEQLSRLVRDELRLARAQVTAWARHIAAAVGLFAGAGVVTGYSVGVLLLTLAVLLALAVPAWAAALIVTVALFALAATLTAVGAARLRRVGSIVPEQTVASVKADLRAVSHAAKRRRQR
ncbi:phage holin family protein [Planosporangium flavigriseum]|uniref:Membrane protein n=1 Tax=Planosporangium flavigriseum TaxID=373681 RepID=A0A8J3M2L0_9ACTN|nr:phage holin family protein [Planosporangium flavigriseum]GIG75600.1 membrane protein [Planosporangium flavigriseum]